jgi:hypothetical protein
MTLALKIFIWWLTAGAFVFVVDSLAMYLRLTGYFGRTVRNQYRHLVWQLGGPRWLFISVLMLSIVVPPVAFASCLMTLRRNWLLYAGEQRAAQDC